MLRHLPRRALCRASLLSRSVTTYRYGADGRVKHEHTEAPLTAPLDPEAAGDATCKHL
jgi:hypothetical protein